MGNELHPKSPNKEEGSKSHGNTKSLAGQIKSSHADNKYTRRDQIKYEPSNVLRIINLRNQNNSLFHGRLRFNHEFSICLILFFGE
jgi:hypothetical protein